MSQKHPHVYGWVEVCHELFSHLWKSLFAHVSTRGLHLSDRFHLINSIYIWPFNCCHDEQTSPFPFIVIILQDSKVHTSKGEIGVACMLNTSLSKCGKKAGEWCTFLDERSGCYSVLYKSGNWFSPMEWWWMFKSLMLTLQAVAMFTGGCQHPQHSPLNSYL